MDKEYIRQILPEEPPEGLLRWAFNNCEADLGPQYLSWKPVKIPVYEMEYLMDNHSGPKRYERAADCTCLKCGGHFLTELCGNVLTLWVDECGEWWPLDPTGGPQPFEDEDQSESGYMVEVTDGDSLPCPFCYENLTVIDGRKLKNGRRKQVLVVSIENVDNYATIVYWLVRRTIYDDGNDYEVIPRDAYVLDEKGVIHRYSHTSGGGAFCSETETFEWRLTSSKKDGLENMYHDWGSQWGNCLHKKKGGVFFKNVPDLTGTTAEKTGLESYAKCDGTYSLEYLKLWKKYPALENLVNTGWTKLVDKIVLQSFKGYSAEAVMYPAIDIAKTKPHEILGMTKGDFKQIRRNEEQWDFDCQFIFHDFRKSGFTSAVDFARYRKLFGDEGIRTVALLRDTYGEQDIEKLVRYMKKQDLQPREIRILLDARNAAKALAGDRALMPEELFPRNLQATHDRLNRAKLLQIDAKKAAKYQQGFDAVLDKYGQLQWTDGTLCILLPKSYAELYQEGEILRHCVGGYSEDHISGSDTIFFVRHYRRPERSYYTLDIDMTERPKRVQIHGYGNERHGINKQYRHSIPKKVLDFCDRWEREVLMPWYRNQHHIEKKEGKTA